MRLFDAMAISVWCLCAFDYPWLVQSSSTSASSQDSISGKNTGNHVNLDNGAIADQCYELFNGASLPPMEMSQKPQKLSVWKKAWPRGRYSVRFWFLNNYWPRCSTLNLLIPEPEFWWYPTSSTKDFPLFPHRTRDAGDFSSGYSSTKNELS